MAETIPRPQLAQISQIIEASMGLHYPENRWSDLTKALILLANESGFDSAANFIETLVSTPLEQDMIEKLAARLTVGETYFWREPKSMQALKNEIIPYYLKTRYNNSRHINIWCAGCCTGEEPYSVAILIDKLIPNWQEWNITILGTDINSLFLGKARGGIYRSWSFRQTPEWVKKEYFTRQAAEEFAISPKIKQMVDFSYYNLVTDQPTQPAGLKQFDIILCRNVLIYFSLETIQKVAKNFYTALSNEGWLILSPSETLHLLDTKFVPTNFDGITFYQKELPAATTSVTPVMANLFSGPSSLACLRFDDDDLAFELTPENNGQAAPPVEPVLAPASSLDRDQTQPPPAPIPLPDASDPDLPQLYQQGQYQAIIRQVEKEVDYNAAEKFNHLPPQEKALLMMVHLYANEGRLEHAQKWCEEAIALNKMNPLHHYLLSTIFQEQGAFNRAVQSLRRTIYLDHQFVLAHFVLGNLARQKGNPVEANRHFNNALQLLEQRPHDQIIPHSEGLTNDRLKKMISQLNQPAEPACQS